MPKLSILKHLLNDNESLLNYSNIDLAKIEAVKRRLFLQERNENRRIPDQHYHLLNEKETNDLTSLNLLLSNGIYNLANTFLELRGQKIYVIQRKQNDWQHLLTYMPPLVLQTAFLAQKKPIRELNSENIIEYFKNTLLPNFQFTALPYPFIPQLELYIKEQNGLHDLHMHLNGSTETDVLWQDFLLAPDKVYKEIKSGFKAEKVKEQYEQEFSTLSPLEYVKLLKVAQRIRTVLFNYLFPIDGEPYFELGSSEKILEEVLKEQGRIHGSYQHPFKKLINDDDKYPYLMAVEALMYVLVFDYLEKEPKPIVASLFHFYLLILGLTNRLLVQQTHQNGFDQFQKITLNDLRSSSEKTFKSRFQQLSGNELRNLKFLEGRFAPQDNEPKSEKLLVSIEEGWIGLLSLLREKAVAEKLDTNLPQLKLTAHFIKKIDKKGEIDDYIRHKDLRKQTWEKAGILANIRDRNKKYCELITAADAASNEFDAPPEVFSPVFRMLRRKGIKHFTYHAGEDFFHLFSGMRAVYEAIEFNNFLSGDRIGHATATGLDAQLWLNNMGKKLLIRRGEWLDDLVFVYHLIVTERIVGLKKHVPFIINEVQKLCYEIYGSHEQISTLKNAWIMRKYCPLHLTVKNREQVNISIGHNEEEWLDSYNARKDKDSLKLYKQYHDKCYRDKYENPIEIDLTEFSAVDIKELQLAILKYMHEKEIVIETLPTSNVRIGHHEDYTTHQLWNWLNWEIEGHPIPPIVMGSDDTGIFATSIYNEYANLYCCATQELGYNHNKTMGIIVRLDRNGRIYRFD